MTKSKLPVTAFPLDVEVWSSTCLFSSQLQARFAASRNCQPELIFRHSLIMGLVSLEWLYAPFTAGKRYAARMFLFGFQPCQRAFVLFIMLIKKKKVVYMFKTWINVSRHTWNVRVKVVYELNFYTLLPWKHFVCYVMVTNLNTFRGSLYSHKEDTLSIMCKTCYVSRAFKM